MPQTGNNLRERLEMLEASLWASELTWNELESLARYLEVARMEPGQAIFHEGDQRSFVCLIVTGRVEVVKRDANGREKPLTEIARGKVFGEMMLFDGEPRSATALAAEESTLLLLSCDNLEAMLADTPRLAAKVIWKLGKIVSQRLRLTSGKLVDFID